MKRYSGSAYRLVIRVLQCNDGRKCNIEFTENSKVKGAHTSFQGEVNITDSQSARVRKQACQ